MIRWSVSLLHVSGSSGVSACDLSSSTTTWRSVNEEESCGRGQGASEYVNMAQVSIGKTLVTINKFTISTKE